MSQKQGSKTLTEAVVGAIRGVVGPGKVALHEPSFEGNEWLYLKECLDSTFVSSVGKFVDRFEEELQTYTGAKYAISVVNVFPALFVSKYIVPNNCCPAVLSKFTVVFVIN